MKIMELKPKIAKLLRHWADKLCPVANFLDPGFDIGSHKLRSSTVYPERVVYRHRIPLFPDQSINFDSVRDQCTHGLSRELQRREVIKFIASEIGKGEPFHCISVEASVVVLPPTTDI